MITDLTSICFFKILSDIRVRNLLQKMRMYLFRSRLTKRSECFHSGLFCILEYLGYHRRVLSAKGGSEPIDATV